VEGEQFAGGDVIVLGAQPAIQHSLKGPMHFRVRGTTAEQPQDLPINSPAQLTFLIIFYCKFFPILISIF